ncbi:MAG: hypothetical protein U1C97_02720, partial [Candidatus Gracilibacteria bacterium]|nr:hypothetical protein [Candidatus Gracilibacteria bacterium]
MKYLAEKFGIALLLVVAALLVYFAFFMGPALVPLQGDVLSNGVVVLYNDVLTTGSTNRFVPGSGYIAVYADQDTGSFDFDQVYFELVSGGKQSVASGLQIFERGTLYVERDSEANSSVHLILYYLPHTEVEENTLLSLLQDDPSAFSSYKIEHRHDIDPLCWALRSELTLPQACPEGGGTPPLVEETL